MFEDNNVPLRSQVTQAMYKLDIQREWARANDLTGTIKLTEYLVATNMDQATVDSGDCTYVWNHLQDACPKVLVSLYRDPVKVLTNSMTTYTDGTTILSGIGKNQVAGLEMKETLVLCQ